MHDEKRQLHNLSHDAVFELQSMLAEEMPDDGDSIEEIISAIDSALIEPGFPENLIATDPKELKSTLSNLRKAAATYLDCEKSVGVVESYWLADSIDHDADIDEELRQYDEYGEYAGMYGSTRHEIRKGIKILIRAIDNVADNLTVKRGQKPDFRARSMALGVLESFEMHDLNATTYDDGIYFKVLEVAFREAPLEYGDEAHRRHGAWAIQYGRDLVE